MDQLRLSLRRSRSESEIEVADVAQAVLANQNELQDHPSVKLPLPILEESKGNFPANDDLQIGKKTTFSSKFGKENKANICKLCRK